MSTDCLGLLLCSDPIARTTIHATLSELYARNKRPVAYIDETYEDESGRDTFYVVAVAVVNEDALHETRAALKDFYGGDALHAAPMWRDMKYESLRQATQLVAAQHDYMDIVVCAPIEESRDAARAKCLAYAAKKIHDDLATSMFVLDSLATPTAMRLDQFTFSDLRSVGDLARETVAIHCRPSEELLLGLPDVLAWSYRQEHVRADPTWFEPLREFTQVTVL